MDSNSSSGWGSSGSAATASSSGWGCAAAAAPAATSGWNSAASGWGRSESSANESVAQRRSSSPSQPRAASPKPISSWARAVSGHVPGNCNNSRSHCDKNSTESSKATTELEKEIRSVPAVDPLLLQADSWGQTVINQDNAWDQPSPHDSGRSDTSSSMWKSSQNTAGTEIWENSVRHKNNSHNKQGAVQPESAAAAVAPAAGATVSHSASQSSSWNHTPATHIGGTWGEEEDSSVVWNGVPHTNGSSNHSHSSTSNASNGSWGGNPVRPADAIADPAPLTSGWKDARGRPDAQERPDVVPLAVRSNHVHVPNHNQPLPQPQPLHPSSSWNGNSSSMNWDEPQPAGPTERLGTSGWSVEVPAPAAAAPRPTALLRCESQPVTSSWKKEERVSDRSVSGSGWDVPDARTLLANGGADRRADQGPGPDVDDGTAAWGNPTRQPAKIHRWKEEDEQQSDTSHPLCSHSNAKMPAANSANGIGAPLSPNGGPVLSSPGMIRLPPSSTKDAAWIKSQPPPPLPQPVQSPAWSESWNENEKNSSQQQQLQQQRGWGDPSTSLWNREQRKGNWSDGQVDTSSWNGPKHKPLTKEMICASKQFRLLSEMGFRKDDVESCLRSANMNEHEALAELRAWSADERRKSSPGNTPTTSLLTSAGPNTSLSGGGRSVPQAFPSVNEVTSALRGQSASRVGAGQANLPSEKQLLHLVHQIQLAVQTGHLNAQILNQPLAPTTIQLIYTLLQQIKHLQQLQIQVANSLSKPGVAGSFQSHLHVQITQTKQRISNYQNQIAVQQALFMKHQQAPTTGPPPDFLRNSDVNSMPEFRDLSLKDQQQQAQNQSRFKTTWKLPSFEKDDGDVFSRAPGGGSAGKGRPEMWSGLNDETGLSNWSDGADIFKETVSQSSSQSAPTTSYLADLVPEFEPGKPWKGSSHMKSIEDDPHVTPGSVNRSPLSVNTIFNNWNSKVSPTDAPTTASAADPLTSLSLCSSTWAFPSSSSGFTSDPISSSQKVSSSWSVIGEPSSTTDSLWSGSSVSKPRGPPPGLSQSSLSQVKQTSAQQQPQHVPTGGSPVSAASQLSFWDSSSNSGQQGQQQQRWSDPRTSSGFLVLRNLTPQIDGSTLKTLCLQHGPVHLFHLLLHNGMCLVSYATQEEANKAQSALNNCVLGNTTILSHVPTESELKQLINQVGQNPPPSSWSSSSAQQNGGSGFRPGSGMGFSANGNKNGAGDAPGQWGSGGGGGLWNYAAAGGGSGAWDERGAGQGLQSNLDDLLGGESN